MTLYCNKKGRKLDIPLVPLLRQSMPRRGLFVEICLDLTSETVSMGLKPEFSAKANGTVSKVSANACMAYCSTDEIYKRKIKDESKRK